MTPAQRGGIDHSAFVELKQLGPKRTVFQKKGALFFRTTQPEALKHFAEKIGEEVPVLKKAPVRPSPKCDQTLNF